jgi:hypothetical protein
MEIPAHRPAIHPQSGGDGTNRLGLLIKLVDLVIQCLPPLLPLASLRVLASLSVLGLRGGGRRPGSYRLLHGNRGQGDTRKNALRHVPQVSQQVPAVSDLYGLGSA